MWISVIETTMSLIDYTDVFIIQDVVMHVVSFYLQQSCEKLTSLSPFTTGCKQ